MVADLRQTRHTLDPDQAPFSAVMVDLLQQLNRSIGPVAAPVRVVLAGGSAMHLYVPGRSSTDVDALVTQRIALPEAPVSYMVDGRGRRQPVSFDAGFSDTLGMMHPDYLERTWGVDVPDVPSLQVEALSPLDLAISKTSRYLGPDEGDIRALIADGWIEREAFEHDAREALLYTIGNTAQMEHNITDVLAIFDAPEPDDPGAGSQP